MSTLRTLYWIYQYPERKGREREKNTVARNIKKRKRERGRKDKLGLVTKRRNPKEKQKRIAEKIEGKKKRKKERGGYSDIC